MDKVIVSRKPKINVFFPVWWHHHGSKMRVDSLDLKDHTLIISGSAAKVEIIKASVLYPKAKGWFVDWEVIQCVPYKERTRGRAWLSKEDLEDAFGLSNGTDEFSTWLIDEYGADCAGQGKYIRWKNYLNIPCPGTGHDGDPNVSIQIEGDIQKAVEQLLE